ncbi:MAG: hypothetical protein V3R99_05360, partial [Thermoguttaceae bacterium]
RVPREEKAAYVAALADVDALPSNIDYIDCVRRRQDLEQETTASILNSLAYLPGVKVAVEMTVKPSRSSSGLSAPPGVTRNDAEELWKTTDILLYGAAASVCIPSSWFEQAWQQRNPPEEGQSAKTPSREAMEEFQQGEVARIRDHVRMLLFPRVYSGSVTKLVSVTVFDSDAAGPPDKSFAWFPLTAKPSNEWITGEHQGQSYVLLSTKPEETMLATDEGSRRWRVEKVEVTKDAEDRPTIGVQFDQAGGQRMGTLSETHLEMPLAILVDDKVLSMPRIMSKINSNVEITGDFDASEAGKMAEALIQGMVDREESKPEEDSASTPASGKPDVYR